MDKELREFELRKEQVEARTKREDAFHKECLEWSRLLRSGARTVLQRAFAIAVFILGAHYTVLLVAVVVPAAWRGSAAFGRALALALGLPFLVLGVVGIATVIAAALIKRARDVD
jgi:hypothetical protein